MAHRAQDPAAGPGRVRGDATQPGTLIIDRPPPVSLNAVLRMNRYERSRHNRLWKNEAAAAWMQAGRPVYERCIVTITMFYRGDRMVQDDDNLYGSVKPILDGLKGRAFPRDDAECITVFVTRRKDNDHPRVQIDLRWRPQEAA